MSTNPAALHDAQPDGFFTRALADADPAVFAGVTHELTREQTQIELIASENIVSRAPIAMALASLWLRASSADSGSATSAQRTAGLRLAAIMMPIPDPHSAIPRSAAPVAIASASLRP